ncbi:MAG: SIMPL domain-containing protein, partial [Luminiphilus sp.]
MAPIVLVGTLFSATIAAQIISVEGKGTVEIEPEYARMSASVSHTSDTASDAQAMVDRVMSRLLTGVDELPVAENSIDAGQIRIQPRYRWNPRSETQEFQGYEATRMLSFKLTSLESLGDALQMLSEQGATTVDAPQYGSSQTGAARGRALAMAFDDAQADAEA